MGNEVKGGGRNGQRNGGGGEMTKHVVSREKNKLKNKENGYLITCSSSVLLDEVTKVGVCGLQEEHAVYFFALLTVKP